MIGLLIGMILKEVVEVVGDGEEVEAVHVAVAVAEIGITRGVNVLVDTETTITRMIITEIGVLLSVFRHVKNAKPYLWGYVLCLETKFIVFSCAEPK